MTLHTYAPAGARAIVELFTETVHTVNIRDYSVEQVDAWAPKPYNLEQWQTRLARTLPTVAEHEGVIVGFYELEDIEDNGHDGHIDCFYVHKDFQGKGVGALMMQGVEASSRERAFKRLYTEASITAEPFFRRHGFRPLAQQEVVRRGVVLINFLMEKML